MKRFALKSIIVAGVLIIIYVILFLIIYDISEPHYVVQNIENPPLGANALQITTYRLDGAEYHPYAGSVIQKAHIPTAQIDFIFMPINWFWSITYGKKYPPKKVERNW